MPGPVPGGISSDPAVLAANQGATQGATQGADTKEPKTPIKTGNTVAKDKGLLWKAKGEDFMKSNQVLYENSGADSAKVAFQYCLGNPARKQPRQLVSNAGGTAQTVVDDNSYQVVGYAFKLLEDMEVPECKLVTSEINSANPADCQMIPRKAGEVVNLNLIETGIFISHPKFGGTFSGEDKSVSLTAKFKGDSQIPLPVLRNNAAVGSIKDNMVKVATVTTVDGKKRTEVLPEYADKFGIIFERKVTNRGTGVSQSKSKGESTKQIAAAFYKFYVQDKGQLNDK